nr:(Fe-S)-binding protein [Candidatus Njordarchaeum guaymaensis]
MSSGLEAYKEMISRCYKCGYCKFTGPVISQVEIREAPFYVNCPSYEKFDFETYSASGRVWAAKGLVDGDLKWSDRLLEIAYACTTCGNCSNQCAYDISKQVVQIIEALREEAVKAGIGPMPAHRRFGEHLVNQHNPYFEPHKERLRWIPKDLNTVDKADLLYFVGCTSSYREKEIAHRTAEMLNELGVQFAVASDEWCCGSPLLRTGQFDAAKQHAKHNVDLIQGMGVKTVLTSCAGCYHTLKADYPARFRLYPRFRVLHATEYLEKSLRDQGRMKLEREESSKKMKVTYHDPCHLGRRSKVYDAPRAIIRSLPGVELVEMKRSRVNSLCCGAGGGVKSAFPEWSLEMACKRVQEAQETGAEVLSSACPFCKRNLSDAVKDTGSSLRVLDVVELAYEHMRK